MKEKEILKAVKRTGGKIKRGSIIYPKLHITTKSEALDLLNIMRYGNDLEENGVSYTVDNLDVPLEALIKAVKKGVL
jgi:hypothetical protein